MIINNNGETVGHINLIGVSRFEVFIDGRKRIMSGAELMALLDDRDLDIA